MTPEQRAADLVDKLGALGWLNHLEPFVRNSIAGALASAIADEREACARAVEMRLELLGHPEHPDVRLCKQVRNGERLAIADAIRGRT